MVREEQLSLCFGPAPDSDEHALTGKDSLSGAGAVELRQSAHILHICNFAHAGSSSAELSNVRLLEKIARKVKYF